MGKPGAQYLKVKTGMMQGILHYTSRLLHGIKILFMKDYISRKMRFNSNKTTKEENEERKVIKHLQFHQTIHRSRSVSNL